MAVIQGHNLARSFGIDDIFDSVSVSIAKDARIALVGPNGTGKTTLLNLLAKRDTPTEGTVTHARNLSIGFLPQEAELALEGEHTLWDEMLTAFADLLALEDQLIEMAEQLAQTSGDDDLLKAYGEAQNRFEQAGGYEYTTLIKRVLGGLGFDEIDFQRPITQLSGGQKTRALLARLLLEIPDLLILDEPTNHLDIKAIEWLEKWLTSFSGALLIVSHDRFFMDSVVNHVWELIFGQLEEYRGNYSHYVTQREERHTRLVAEYERQQEYITETEEFIKRNIAGQNTRQAQGRRKRLERFMRDEALARPREQRFMRIDLEARRRSGDEVLRTKNLVLGYHDDKVPLFAAPDITLMRGECAALIGPNGAGKSTFLKTILGELEPLSGRVEIGAGVEIGYFAQAHEGLDHDNSILDEILSVKNLPISEARKYLGSFLFTGDDVFKPISTLSGGERGRVALAKLALSGANLLILDEPTNHLDIPSQEILEAVLADFNGTILLVSHDRYLIHNLATQIWALDTPRSSDQSQLAVYEGTYKEYVAWREKQSSGGSSQAHRRTTKSDNKSNGAAKSGMTKYQREKRLAQVEGEIHTLETELEQVIQQLETASAAGYVDQVAELGERYTQIEVSLGQFMEEWEALLAEE